MRALAQHAADDLEDPVSFVRQLHKLLPFSPGDYSGPRRFHRSELRYAARAWNSESVSVSFGMCAVGFWLAGSRS